MPFLQKEAGSFGKKPQEIVQQNEENEESESSDHVDPNFTPKSETVQTLNVSLYELEKLPTDKKQKAKVMQQIKSKRSNM